MTKTKKISMLYVATVAVITVGSLVYTAVADIPSMRNTAGGVPYLTPPVLNPDTGEGVELGVLVRHFQGD